MRALARLCAKRQLEAARSAAPPRCGGWPGWKFPRVLQGDGGAPGRGESQGRMSQAILVVQNERLSARFKEGIL